MIIQSQHDYLYKNPSYIREIDLLFSVGVSDTATTVQVAVQTPPSRRRGTAKTQTKLVKKIKKYDFGLDIEHIDAKLRPQNNQIMPQGEFLIL